MTRGYVILMFLMAAVLLCSHQQAVAKNIVTYLQSRFSATTSCSDSDKGKIKKCMTQTVSIDKCCPLFKRTIGANCKCYNYAEDLDNQALITLQSYCDVNNPCKSVQDWHSGSGGDHFCQPKLRAQLKCSAADKAKVKTCMTKTSSIDACCPTFRSILGKSCPCYSYAMELDNQALITLEAYCDVSNPCNKVQVI
ncbi:hypothetical protein H5410_064635 [Solanum commersonii]|uniref:Uncharacterized protein n=1 Tax=Solanum commersonii TaxID=4109 RepID=A0A9J5VYX1_SOLCO|nr:hypothetical protein H5410_064635 [Solanum commersonii]